jgi:hypothetical protein
MNKKRQRHIVFTTTTTLVRRGVTYHQKNGSKAQAVIVFATIVNASIERASN